MNRKMWAKQETLHNNIELVPNILLNKSSKSNKKLLISIALCLMVSCHHLSQVAASSIASIGDNFESHRLDASITPWLPSDPHTTSGSELSITSEAVASIADATGELPLNDKRIRSSGVIGGETVEPAAQTASSNLNNQAIHELPALDPQELVAGSQNVVTTKSQQAATNGRAPVYMSAPKQVNGLNQLHRSSTGRAQLNSLDSLGLGKKKSQSDLQAAGGKHYKPKKKKKVIIVKKKKKKKKKHKKKKKIIIVKKKKKKPKKKKKVIYVHMKKKHHKKKHYKKKMATHYVAPTKVRPEPAHHGHESEESGGGSGGYHSGGGESGGNYAGQSGGSGLGGGGHGGHHGKFYEYRSVPKKGAWEFGYKRGNHKHLIERKEHGHKSHFKTEVNWKDKKGKGHHSWDYNHGDKKHHGYYAAAASGDQPTATVNSNDQSSDKKLNAASSSMDPQVQQEQATNGQQESQKEQEQQQQQLSLINSSVPMSTSDELLPADREQQAEKLLQLEDVVREARANALALGPVDSSAPKSGSLNPTTDSPATATSGFHV